MDEIGLTTKNELKCKVMKLQLELLENAKVCN